MIFNIVHLPVFPPPSLPLSLTLSLLCPQSYHHRDVYDVELKKDSSGLGITIAGVEQHGLQGIVVTSITAKGPADCSGKMATGDQVLTVSTDHLTISRSHTHTLHTHTQHTHTTHTHTTHTHTHTHTLHTPQTHTHMHTTHTLH